MLICAHIQAYSVRLYICIWWVYDSHKETRRRIKKGKKSVYHCLHCLAPVTSLSSKHYQCKQTKRKGHWPDSEMQKGSEVRTVFGERQTKKLFICAKLPSLQYSDSHHKISLLYIYFASANYFPFTGSNVLHTWMANTCSSGVVARHSLHPVNAKMAIIFQTCSF